MVVDCRNLDIKMASQGPSSTVFCDQVRIMVNRSWNVYKALKKMHCTQWLKETANVSLSFLKTSLNPQFRSFPAVKWNSCFFLLHLYIGRSSGLFYKLHSGTGCWNCNFSCSWKTHHILLKNRIVTAVQNDILQKSRLCHSFSYLPNNHIDSTWLFWYYDNVNKKEDTFSILRFWVSNRSYGLIFAGEWSSVIHYSCKSCRP